MEGQICRVDGCNNTLSKTDGQVCPMHRNRWWRHKSYDVISPNWTILKKGQALPTKYGYLRINVGDGRGRILYHRHVMELHLGRKLTPRERVHHKNHNPLDNRIENLELLNSQSEHISKHHAKKPLVDWSKYSVPKRGRGTKCLIENCKLPTKYRSLCSKHYISFHHNAFERSYQRKKP